MSKKKDKSMSKRELVSYIRAITGLSYKESRMLCKQAKYIEALSYHNAVDYVLKKAAQYFNSIK